MLGLLPIGGDGIHFYKTLNPPSNLGPYTREQIDNAIDSTGLFISYIGHSGTETWDNGITEVSDLKPKFSDRLSLISDFGCSTGKFAEPNVDAFGELFVSASNDGQAIAYLGNSSWGYVSTSTNFPQLFYNQLLLDSSFVFSEAHYLAKIELLNQYGTSDVNRVFNYCNILFGDPLIAIKLPHKPNFSVSNNLISLVDQFPTDVDDSVEVKIEIINFGEVLIDSLTININDFYLGNISYSTEFKIPVPYYKKMLYISIPTKGLVGQHNLEITLDRNNIFDEIYENDNSTIFNFIVYSSSIRPIEAERFYNSAKNKINLLNPVFSLYENVSTLEINLAENPDFINSLQEELSIDTLFTIYQFQSLQSNKRYWLRARLNTPLADWSEPFSFFMGNDVYSWYFNHSFNSTDVQSSNVVFDSTSANWKLSKFENLLEIGSAGFNDGSYGSIKLNNLELLPNTAYWGIATAIIDSITLQPSDIRYFVYHEPMIADTLLIAYIDSLPSNTLLAMTIATDGAQSVLGYVSGTPVRQAIETLGSYYIDSVFYRDSWCMIGKKGAAQGTVPEAFSKSSNGPASLRLH